MQFTASNILLTLFTGLVAGLASYFGSYTKAKAEMRAATENLNRTIEILTSTTRAVEGEKARIATDSALAADRRRVVCALATAMQSLVHSMCWLSWDVVARRTVRTELAKMYDAEVHKLLPEILGHVAVVRMLDEALHASLYEHITEMISLDVFFGNALVLAESNEQIAVSRFSDLQSKSFALWKKIDESFGGLLQLSATQRNLAARGKMSEAGPALEA